MLKIEKTEVVGWEAAIRGMRNPMNSWDQSDSFICREEAEMTNEERKAKCNKCPRDTTTCGIYDKDPHFIIGPNDLDLIMKLRAAGIDHRKFMRMIEVYVDITAPLYWWKEFDTYKVGTVANSCSTMHKIAAKEFTLEDFSHEHLLDVTTSKDNGSVYLDGIKHTSRGVLLNLIDCLNHFRKLYLKTKDKKYWWQMIQLLPTSYNQKRTIMLSYEVLANIYKSRRHHKLDEWHTLCDWIEGLPYSKMITGGADYLNKKLTIPESDEIIADTLRKLQSSDSLDQSKAILMGLYEQLKKVETSTPPNDFKIADEWNQYGRVDFIQSVKSSCDLATDTINKLQKKFWLQEKGDISDAKPE